MGIDIGTVLFRHGDGSFVLKYYTEKRFKIAKIAILLRVKYDERKILYYSKEHDTLVRKH